MASVKRKALESQLQRRVRARRDLSEDLEDVHDSDSSLPEVGENKQKAFSEERPENSEESEEHSEDELSSLSEAEPVAAISFGALAKAQASLQNQGKDRKHSGVKKSGEVNGKTGPHDDTWQNNEALERKAGRKDQRGFSRSSKHAPTEISSKKAVSRKREVVAVAKREYRDPRFEPLSGALDESKVSKAYSFLDDYREDEMKELKNSIRKTKDETEKDKLKRVLISMESKKKAQDRRRKEQEILDKHKKEEKELVKQGKKPFFLKKAEQHKRMLVEQYSGLKGKQLEHVLERRRKKQDAKEKRKMPWARREVEQ